MRRGFTVKGAHPLRLSGAKFFAGEKLPPAFGCRVATRYSFASTLKQGGASLLAWLRQEPVRFRPTFLGARFHSIGTVADTMTG